MTALPAHEILRRLFDVILREAESNDAFARRMLASVQGEIALACADKPKATPARRAFDASAFHAINILRLHGENVLRGKLEQVRAVEDLRAVARESGLLLCGAAARSKASRNEVIDGIIAAAKHYDAQRTTASA